MQAVFPVDETKGLSDTNARIIQLNEMLKALAEEKGHTFINIQGLFLNSEGNLKSLLHVGDGLHLSTEGYKLWITALNQTFSNLSDWYCVQKYLIYVLNLAWFYAYWTNRPD